MKLSMTMQGLEPLEQFLKGELQDLRPKCERAMTLIGTRWVAEAKRRVPVATGLLRNSIIKDTGFDFQGPYCAVGSNQKYAKYLEFGTKFIAGGAVQRLGTSDEITDAQAIHSWPAKDGSAGITTSHYYGAGGSLFNVHGDEVGHVGGASGKKKSFLTKAGNIVTRNMTGAQEQMPWLRPAFMAIQDWVVKKIIDVFKFEN